MIESAWSIIKLPELASAMRYRLTGLVFGHVDYASDIALPDISFQHPVADWARAQIVNVAGAFGVPAINGMTMNYPVADPALSAAQNRSRILERMRECYADTQHGIGLGMKGKWVGHPAQLFVALLAYRLHHSSQGLQQEIKKIRLYQEALLAQEGVTVIDGVMSDRATDRHARVRLREAVALGLLSKEEGLALEVISPTEAAALPPDTFVQRAGENA
jgi:citrate lyase beta subunit